MQWDTGGHDQFDAITPNYFRNVHGVILVYDITDKGSLDKVDYWHQEAKRHLPEAEFILIGNKTDKFMERKLSTLDGQVIHTRALVQLNSLQRSRKRKNLFTCRPLLTDSECHFSRRQPWSRTTSRRHSGQYAAIFSLTTTFAGLSRYQPTPHFNFLSNVSPLPPGIPIPAQLGPIP